MSDEAASVQALIDQAAALATLKVPVADGIPGGSAEPAKPVLDAGAKGSGQAAPGGSPPAAPIKEEPLKAPVTAAPAAVPPAPPPPPVSLTYEYRGQQYVETSPEKIRTALAFAHDYSEKMGALRREKESPDYKVFQDLQAEVRANPELGPAISALVKRADDRKFLKTLAEGKAPDEDAASGEPADAGRDDRLARLERAEERRTLQAEANDLGTRIVGAIGKFPEAFKNPATRKLVAKHLAVEVAQGRLTKDDLEIEAGRLAGELLPATPAANGTPAPLTRTPHTPEPGRGAGAPLEQPATVRLGENTEATAEAYVRRLAETR